MVFIKNTRNNKRREGVEREVPSHTAGGNTNGCSHGGKRSEAPQKQKKNQKQNYHVLSDSTTEYLPKEQENTPQKATDTAEFMAAAFTAAKCGSSPRVQSQVSGERCGTHDRTSLGLKRMKSRPWQQYGQIWGVLG